MFANNLSKSSRTIDSRHGWATSWVAVAPAAFVPPADAAEVAAGTAPAKAAHQPDGGDDGVRQRRPDALCKGLPQNDDDDRAQGRERGGASLITRPDPAMLPIEPAGDSNFLMSYVDALGSSQTRTTLGTGPRQS